MKKCKNCRHVNRDTESFCEECGAPLMNESMHQEENQAQPSMNKGTNLLLSDQKEAGSGCFFLCSSFLERVAIFSGRIIFLRNNKFLILLKRLRMVMPKN